MNLPVPIGIGPGANHGIPQFEVAMAEMLKTNGYATAAIGKWHLGDADSSLPNNNGFDYFFLHKTRVIKQPSITYNAVFN